MGFPQTAVIPGFIDTDGTADQLLFDNSDGVAKTRTAQIYVDTLSGGSEILTIKAFIKRWSDDAMIRLLDDITIAGTSVKKTVTIEALSCKGFQVKVTQAGWTTARRINFEIHTI